MIGHDGKHVGSARQRDSSIFFSVNVPCSNADTSLIEAITLSESEGKPPKRSLLDFLKPKKHT